MNAQQKVLALSAVAFKRVHEVRAAVEAATRLHWVLQEVSMRELWSNPIPLTMQQHGGRSKSAALSRDEVEEKRKALQANTAPESGSDPEGAVANRTAKSRRPS